MYFEWDSAKAAENVRKHQVSFEEASEGEERLITFGMSSKGRLLVVSQTERGEAIRIISARRATRRERQIYEEG